MKFGIRQHKVLIDSNFGWTPSNINPTLREPQIEFASFLKNDTSYDKFENKVIYKMYLVEWEVAGGLQG
jgi:hypothetical protein